MSKGLHPPIEAETWLRPNRGRRSLLAPVLEEAKIDATCGRTRSSSRASSPPTRSATAARVGHEIRLAFTIADAHVRICVRDRIRSVV